MDQDQTPTVDQLQGQLGIANQTIAALKVMCARRQDALQNQQASFGQMLDKWMGHFEDTRNAANSGEITQDQILATFDTVQADMVSVKSIGLVDLAAALAPPPTDGSSPASVPPLAPPTDPSTIAVSATPTAAPVEAQPEPTPVVAPTPSTPVPAPTPAPAPTPVQQDNSSSQEGSGTGTGTETPQPEQQ
jgi:hypothetical protein